MTLLLVGLFLFIGTHSLRIVAEPWRLRAIARVGVPVWRAVYSVLAIAGFYLVLKGYVAARIDSALLYTLPDWARHLSSLLMLPALILLVAAYVPGTHIKARVSHPMMLSVRLWAVAHLLSNGRVADVVLFGSFLAWAVFAHHAARRRDRLAGTTYPAIAWSRDAIAVAVGGIAWAGILVYLHRWLSGVPLM